MFERGFYGIKKLYLIRIKSFVKNLILRTSGAEFLYVLTKNGKRKQDAKLKKLSAPLKSVLRDYAEKLKDYTCHKTGYTHYIKTN